MYRSSPGRHLCFCTDLLLLFSSTKVHAESKRLFKERFQFLLLHLFFWGGVISLNQSQAVIQKPCSWIIIFWGPIRHALTLSWICELSTFAFANMAAHGVFRFVRFHFDLGLRVRRFGGNRNAVPTAVCSKIYPNCFKRTHHAAAVPRTDPSLGKIGIFPPKQMLASADCCQPESKSAANTAQ